MEQAVKIINDIQSGIIKPIYFLMGEETYYIDIITAYIEENVLSADEKGFNQMVLYGRDTTIEEVIANAKRYPMMADRQVVIVREAQDLSRSIDQLEAYVQNPQPTTILVMAYKYKTLDKRKKLTQLLTKNGLVFESKKLYENQVPTWITRVIQGNGLGIEPKAAAMLVEFLGADLSRISNELEKLKIVFPKGHTVTPKDIEVNIGFSKDFNHFELRAAIGQRDQLKAYRIAEYFTQNPKENPIIVTTSLVFAFFAQLLQFHGLKDKSQGNVAKVLGVNPYFVKDYELAARNFPMKKVSAVVAKLRDIDAKSKGVGASNMAHGDLLKELLVVIFN